MEGVVQIKIGKSRPLHRTIIEIRSGVYDRSAEVSLLSSKLSIQIGQQLVKTVYVTEFEIATKTFLEHLDIRMQIAISMAPEKSPS